MQIEWWYWIISGFCLIGLELIFPSFTIIWLGLGALVVGIFTSIWHDFPIIGQFTLWIVTSVTFSLMWFKYIKPKKNQ
jgi:inner membrane protein